MFKSLQKPAVAVALAILPICSLFGIGALRPGGAAASAISHGIGGGAVKLTDGARLATLAAPFVVNSKYEGRVNVSKPPTPGFLNLYAVDPKSLGLPQLACNCAFVGDEIVACDQAFLDTFVSSINFGDRDSSIAETLTKVDRTFEAWLGAWIVGHEIGHAVMHAKQIGLRPATATGEVAARLEAEADRFFAERIPSEHLQRATFALTTFAFQMLSATYVQSSEGTDSVSIVKGGGQQIHQPWLIRALDVAHIISERQSGAGSGEDFYGSLRGKVRVGADGIDIGTFCDRSSLRGRVDDAMEQRRIKG